MGIYLPLALLVLHSVSPIYSLPKPPEVSEEMIQSIISSIKKVIESEELNIDIEQHSSNEAAPDPVEAETEAVITKKTESKITTTVPSSSTTILTTTTSETTTTTRTITFDEKDYSEEICDTVPNNSLLRNGLGSTGFTWPDGVIPYEISEGFNETQKETIEEAVEYYNREFKDCISWIKRSDESNYVIFENTGTCSSRIGVAFYPLPLSQTINLGKCSHLLGHIKHEMMHTIGFYHEHSRSDRDMYIEIEWNNIPLHYQAQFSTYRWTVGYGENYDYESIMHYSSRAFVRDYNDKSMRSIKPKDKSIDPDDLGFKANLSEIDKKKIRKMYKCNPYNDYKVGCTNDDNCGLNEYCALFVGECRTKLPDGSVCLLDKGLIRNIIARY